MPCISVVMSTYNETDQYLKCAIESMLNQEYRDFEFIIVIDNPNNVELEKVILDYQKKDDRIKVIKNEKNIGLAMSLNKAIDLAKGAYIARMDADDISMPNRLDKQIRYLEKNGLDLVGCFKQDIDSEGLFLGNVTCYKIPQEKISKMLTLFDFIPHPTWIVKKEVYTNLGGYRNLRRSQDYDFLLRAVNKNVKIGICQEILLLYRINPNGITQNQQFQQSLTAKYLLRKIKKIDKITADDINFYINKKNTLAARNKYFKAQKLFDSAKKNYKKKNMKFFLQIIKACIIDPSFIRNILLRLKIYWILYK